jgi:hypothetical protein
MNNSECVMSGMLYNLPSIEDLLRNNPTWAEELLTPKKASKFLGGIPEASLAAMRSRGGGPAFVRISTGKRGRVAYTRRALLEWIAKQTRHSTSDPGPDLTAKTASRRLEPKPGKVASLPAPRRSRARARERERVPAE